MSVLACVSVCILLTYSVEERVYDTVAYVCVVMLVKDGGVVVVEVV